MKIDKESRLKNNKAFFFLIPSNSFFGLYKKLKKEKVPYDIKTTTLITCAFPIRTIISSL